jgi:hypothetical protein
MYEAAGLQPDQRFAHRGAGYLEERRQRLFAQARTGAQPPRKDGIHDHTVDVQGELVHPWQGLSG